MDLFIIQQVWPFDFDFDLFSLVDHKPKKNINEVKSFWQLKLSQIWAMQQDNIPKQFYKLHKIKYMKKRRYNAYEKHVSVVNLQRSTDKFSFKILT